MGNYLHLSSTIEPSSDPNCTRSPQFVYLVTTAPSHQISYLQHLSRIDWYQNLDHRSVKALAKWLQEVFALKDGLLHMWGAPCKRRSSVGVGS